jgi:dTDP-4-dehydrorhamnose reductase
MQKKVLVISKDGAVGCELYNKLKNQKKYIFTSKKKNYKYYFNLSYLNYKNLPKPESISCIILLAGVTSIKRCENQYKETKKINVTNSYKLLEYYKDSKKIFISSSSVFDGSDKRAKIDEKKNFINKYGKQKSLLEDLIRKKLDNYVILRCTKIITNKIPLEEKIAKCVKKKKFFYAFDDIFLQPILFTDFFKNLIKIIKNNNSNSILHLNGEKKISSFDFVKSLFSKFKLDTRYLKKTSGLNFKHQPNLLVRKL